MSSVIIIVLFNYDVNILKVKMIRLICYYFFFGLYDFKVWNIIKGKLVFLF